MLNNLVIFYVFVEKLFCILKNLELDLNWNEVNVFSIYLFILYGNKLMFDFYKIIYFWMRLFKDRV